MVGLFGRAKAAEGGTEVVCKREDENTCLPDPVPLLDDIEYHIQPISSPFLMMGKG